MVAHTETRAAHVIRFAEMRPVALLLVVGVACSGKSSTTTVTPAAGSGSAPLKNPYTVKPTGPAIAPVASDTDS